ncbi:MAG TPA: hypothetical protein VGJ93_02570 [Desulfuromonadaceae bacterium]|jgi:hypothetical protein
MSNTNILKHPVFYAIPVVTIFALYMFFAKSSFATGDLFGSNKIMNRPHSVVSGAVNNLNNGQPISVKPLPIQSVSSPVPIQQIVSSGRTPMSVVTSAPVLVYSRYKIDSYIDLGHGQVLAYVNGLRANFPNPDVKSYDLRSMVCVARSDVYGSSNK